MCNYQIGDKFIIHSYKHDKSIHRAWDEAILLDICDDYLVFGNNKTEVIESDGRVWHTKEPAILFFYEHSWYNVIGQMKTDGIYYYCNIASPYVIEDKTIKYIDYDRGEYNYHKKKMHYPNELDKILKDDLSSLIEIVRKKDGPFNHDLIEHYHDVYNNLKKRH